MQGRRRALCYLRCVRRTRVPSFCWVVRLEGSRDLRLLTSGSLVFRLFLCGSCMCGPGVAVGGIVRIRTMAYVSTSMFF